MPATVPSLSCLYYWHRDAEDLRRLQATPAGCMERLALYDDRGLAEEGAELVLAPRKLDSVPGFDPAFYDLVRDRPYVTIHLDDRDFDFLSAPDARDAMRALGREAGRVNAAGIVIHASHLRHDLPARRQLLAETLPSETVVMVENNGMDSAWGYDLRNLRWILEQCPEFRVVLDIAHLDEVADGLTLDDVRAEPLIVSRIAQIHYSRSTALAADCPYADRGLREYRPMHSLFSVLGMEPDADTLDFVRRFNVVAEGLQPLEDQAMEHMRQEMDLVRAAPALT